jgi:WD40 repeat protein
LNSSSYLRRARPGFFSGFVLMVVSPIVQATLVSVNPEPPQASVRAGSAYCLAVSPDGRWLASSYGVYESAGGRHAVDFYDGSRPGGVIPGVYGVAFSADGRRLACASEHGKVYLLDTRSWEVAERITLGNANLDAVSFSPDGEWLATGEVEGGVRLWRVGPLSEAGVLGRHPARVNG